MSNKILLEKNGAIAQIFLNEPEKLNALSGELKEQFHAVLNEIEYDPAIKIVVISGKGRAFCAGGDLKGMREDGYNPSLIRKNMELSSGNVMRLRNMSKLVISAIHGYCAGAGFSLALASDLIVAEQNTRIILSFKNVGLIPDLGIHYYLPKIVGEWKAKEWIWKGMNITVEEAVEHGFPFEIVSEGKGLERAMEIATELNEGPFEAFVYSKSLINQSSTLKIEDVILRENEIHTLLRSTKDHKEGLQAFFEKRSPQFNK